MIRAVIVDDERLARQRIRTLLVSHADIAIAGEYESGGKALAALERSPADLLFLDIEMPGMDGFDLLAALAQSSPRVIFVTAHEEHALRAFDVHALDYLLKPIDDDRFHEAVRHVVGRPSEPLRHLVVPEKGRLRVVPVDEVESIEAEEKYVRVHSRYGAHLLRRAISDLERVLDSQRFVRIHRGAIVNARAIATFRNDSVVLESGRQVPVSRRLQSRLRRFLDRS
jgi:two-component system, LytTR family, response regulator